MSELKLADSVLHRFVQIIQESMLLGVDCADLLRQVRLELDESDSSVLVLTSDYRKLVKETYDKLEEQAKKLQEERLGDMLVGTGNSKLS